MISLKHALSALLLASSLAVPTSGIAREAVIALSPFGTVEEKLADIGDIATHLAETVAPGEQGFVINAYDQARIATFTVPNAPDRYGNVRAKMRANPAFFVAMKTFAENAKGPGADKFDGQIDFPALVRTIDATYPTDRPRDLILYNVSPVTHDPRTPGLSMRGGAVPDDGHVAASRAVSVYGSDGETGALANYTLHWGMNGDGWSVSDRHAFAMQRYLALSVSERGGVLATFASVPMTALQNAASGISEPVGSHILKPTDQPTMIHYGTEAHAEEEAELVPIYERDLSTRAPARAELRAAQRVEVGIRWTCQCDFDLAVRPEGGDVISFRQLRTSHGRLHKDFTSSEALDNGWETVILPGPLDLTAVLIVVNLYRGRAGADVELRVAIGAETWGQQYSFPAASDGGSGFARTMASGAPANPAWVVVDPALVLEGN